MDSVVKHSVLFAVPDPADHPFAQQLRAHPRVATVRPCADLSDLLTYAATAGSGIAFVDLAHVGDLDRSAIAALGRHGIRVVGIVSEPDAAAHERFHRLGIDVRLGLAGGRCDPVALDEAIHPRRPGPDPGPRRSVHWRETTLDALLGESEQPATGVDLLGPPGRGLPGPVIAVWGPTGAPGRSTVAVALAREFALAGLETLLVDADSYGGALALRLGQLDDVSTLATAVRLADAGRLDAQALVGAGGLAAPLPDGVRLLSGITDPARWPQVRPAGLDAVLVLAADHVERVVVDCGFCLEQDEELSYDTAAPRRNGATLAVLARADAIVAVGTGDPVGAARLQAGLAELAQLVPAMPPIVVLNRIGSLGRSARAGRQLGARWRAATPGLQVRLLPEDPGQEGPLRAAIAEWVHDLPLGAGDRTADPG